MNRRVIQLVLLLLVAGAVVNVAVAWGCAVIVQVPRVADTYACANNYGLCDSWIVGIYRHYGQTRVTSGWRVQISSPPAPTDNHPSDLVPPWAPFLYPNEQSGKTLGLRIADARGWPLASMFAGCEVQTFELIGLQVIGAKEIHFVGGKTFAFGDCEKIFAGMNIAPSSDPKLSPFHVRMLPTHPIWPGFAINTIFYAAILWGGWAVFFVPGQVKRTLRRRRGQCPACAYPVGTSPVCTECGNQIPVSTVART